MSRHAVGMSSDSLTASSPPLYPLTPFFSMNEPHPSTARRFLNARNFGTLISGFIGWILAHLLISNWADLKDMVRNLF